MPVVACPFCSVAAQLPDPWPYPGFTCNHCRANVALVQQPPEAPAPVEEASRPNRPPLSRTAYILLGIVLGIFGAHNYYAKRAGVGFCQLLLALGAAFFHPLIIISFAWVIIDIITVERDGRGRYMV